MSTPPRSGKVLLADPYRWRVRLFNGSEYTAGSAGGDVPLQEAIRRENVAMVMFVADGLPNVSFAVFPERQFFHRNVAFRPCEWRDYPFYVDQSGMVRYIALGYEENGRAVETRIYGNGLVHVHSYEVERGN